MSLQDIKDSFSRVGVQLVLGLKGRKEPLYGEITRPLRPGGDSVGFRLWGSGTLNLKVSDVRTAVAPDLTHAAFREIRERQAQEFGGAARGVIAIEDPTIRDNCDD